MKKSPCYIVETQALPEKITEFRCNLITVIKDIKRGTECREYWEVDSRNSGNWRAFCSMSRRGAVSVDYLLRKKNRVGMEQMLEAMKSGKVESCELDSNGLFCKVNWPLPA